MVHFAIERKPNNTMVKAKKLTLNQIRELFIDGISKIEGNRLRNHEVTRTYLLHLWALQKSFREIPPIRAAIADANMSEVFVRFPVKLFWISRSSTVVMHKNLRSFSEDSDVLVDIYLSKKHIQIEFRNKWARRTVRDEDSVNRIKAAVRANLQLGLHIINLRMQYQLARDERYQTLRLEPQIEEVSNQLQYRQLEVEFEVMDKTLDEIAMDETIRPSILRNAADFYEM